MRIESSILSPEELHKELCIIYRKAIEIESKRKGKPIFEMNLGLNFVFYPVPKSTDIKPYLVNVFLCHPYDSGNVIEDIYARIEIVGYDGVFDKDTLSEILNKQYVQGKVASINLVAIYYQWKSLLIP